MDGIALGVHGGIVIYRCAEERDHPFVDVVETVVAQPIGEASARDCGRETLRAGLGPHGHKSAVTVPADADPSGVDRVLPGDRIHSGHDVEVVAAPKVLYIALCERFSLSVAPARVWPETEVPHGCFRPHSILVPL